MTRTEYEDYYAQILRLFLERQDRLRRKFEYDMEEVEAEKDAALRNLNDHFRRSCNTRSNRKR